MARSIRQQAAALRFAARPATALPRRLFRVVGIGRWTASVDRSPRQVAQSHPIMGTPWEVPVPRKVIRTPYEEPIKCSDEVPAAEIEKSKHKDFLLKLRAELGALEAKVEEEREFW